MGRRSRLKILEHGILKLLERKAKKLKWLKMINTLDRYEAVVFNVKKFYCHLLGRSRTDLLAQE